MRIRFAISLLLPSLLLAGCGGDPQTTSWEKLGNSDAMQYHSDLRQINSGTIGKLGLAWAVDLPTNDGLVGNPLIKNGLIFQSGKGGQVIVNDLRTGKLKWTYEPESIDHDGFSEGTEWGLRYNRGVALSGKNVIVASNCALVALDQETGRQIWRSQSCDPKDGYGITAAPRVGGGMIFTGNSCGDVGTTRGGYVDAFDALSGKRLWRFYTLPDDPSKPPIDDVQAMALKTWGEDWHRQATGCGNPWDAMVYDDKTGLLVFGVGGPGPFVPTRRGKGAGDELFSNSIVAVDAKSGRYAWHFKQVPHDAWNYEPAVGLMLADVRYGDKVRHVLFSVPKNGFFYVLDAKTGQFISGKNYVPTTWATGLNPSGRPIVPVSAHYWENGGKPTIVSPGPLGSHGWHALAFDPSSQIVFIPVMQMPALFRMDKGFSEDFPLIDFTYGSAGDPKWSTFGEIVAWDPIAQKQRWRHRLKYAVNGGLLHTADLVIGGTGDGELEALKADTGEKIWSLEIGGAVHAAPSTVMMDGEQYLIVTTGSGSSSGTGNFVAQYSSSPRARTAPRLLAFKIGGTGVVPKFVVTTRPARPPQPRFEASATIAGYKLFVAYGCTACHGTFGESAGGSIPDLRYAPPPDFALFKKVVVGGQLVNNGMPRFPEMPEDDARKIYSFIINSSWDAHEGKPSVRLSAHGEDQ